MNNTTLPPSVVTEITLGDGTIWQLNDQNRIIDTTDESRYVVGKEVFQLHGLKPGDEPILYQRGDYKVYRARVLDISKV